MEKIMRKTAVALALVAFIAAGCTTTPTALPALDLEQLTKVARIEQKLLLAGPSALARPAERDPVEAAGQPLRDRRRELGLAVGGAVVSRC